jgi:tetratricopeptide (TPR) repeat protein
MLVDARLVVRPPRRDRPQFAAGRQGEVALQRFASLRLVTAQRQCRDEVGMRVGYVVRIDRDRPARPVNRLVDLALQCVAGLRKGGYIGKEADAAYGLCEQALAIDPDNSLAANFLNIKTWLPAALGLSADPKADFKRADEVVSRMLARDPSDHSALGSKGHILQNQAHYDEAIAEHERSLALDPSEADVVVGLAFDYLLLGQFEKSLELFDKTIRMSPLDPALLFWYGGKSSAYFGLKQYGLGVGVGRGRAFQAGALGLGELQLHRSRQMGDDLVLHLQEIGAGGVELFGPEMRAALGVDELGVDPRLIAALAGPSLPAHSARPDPCRSPWRLPACP